MILEVVRESLATAMQSSKVTSEDRAVLTAAHVQTRGYQIQLRDSEQVREVLGRMRIAIANERTDEGKIIKR